jgi:hypothetical protein
MSARRLVVVCGTVVLAGWVAGGLARFGSSGIDDTGAPTEDSRATSVNVDAEPVDAPQATTTVTPAPMRRSSAPLCPALVRCCRPKHHTCWSRPRARLIPCKTTRRRQ